MAASPNFFVLANFDNSNGDSPNGSLISDAAGDLFGMTNEGGPGGLYGAGVVFELVNSGSGYSAPVTLASFHFGDSGGFFPNGGLISDAVGDLFGTMNAGGLNGYGSVFELMKSGSGYSAPITLASFNGASGANPAAGLISDAAGDLFGTTDSLGAGGCGTVYELVNTAGVYSAPVTLANFTSSNGDSSSSLLMDAAGNLFGTTYGGTGGYGTVFELAHTGSSYSAPITLASFNGANGYGPSSGLISDAAGDLFGTTAGLNGGGTVYELVNTGLGYTAPITLASFPNVAGPDGGLICDAAGNLFGAVYGGGENGFGSVFELVKTGFGYSAPVTVFSFNSSDGYGPSGSLLADTAGDLFGTAAQGGASGCGVVFEIAHAGFAGGPPTVEITSAQLQSNQTGVSLSGTIDAIDAGLTISIYDGATLLGTTVSSGDTWSISVTVSAQGVHTLTAQATNSGGAGVSTGVVDLVNASASLPGGQSVLFSGTSALKLTRAGSGTLSGFAPGDAIALASLPYKSSYEAAFYASAGGGTLKILDTANNNAVVASLPFSGSLAGEAFTLSADPTAGTHITLLAAAWANPQAGDVLFTDVPGQAYSAYQYNYTAGSFVGSQFYYTGIAGQPYTAEEIDYNGGGQLTRAAFSGVTGQPYSSYEYDYVGGVFYGSKFTYTSVPAGAAYSSYVVDYDQTNTFAGEQFYFTNVQGQSYTGEEMDFNASVGLSRVLLTGVQNQAYSSLELDYAGGVYTGYKAFYTGIAGQSYTAEEVDVSASNQLEKVVYSGMTSTPYSSVEQDYTGGALSDVIYGFTNVSGQPYTAYQVMDDAGGQALQETLDLASGGHDLIALTAGQTLTSLGNDAMTGSASGATTFVLNAIYGHDTITNLTSADAVSLPAAEFATFNALLGAAQNNAAGGVTITAGDGDTLTLNTMTKTALAGMSANFAFHG